MELSFLFVNRYIIYWEMFQIGEFLVRKNGASFPRPSWKIPKNIFSTNNLNEYHKSMIFSIEPF